MKKSLFLVALVTLALLSGCQRVSDTRTQACDTMRGAREDLVSARTAIMASNTVQTVGQARATIQSTRAKFEATRAIATAVQSSGGSLTALTQALNQLESDMQGVPDNTPITQIKDKIAPTIDTAVTSAQSLYDTVCAAR